MGKKKGLEITTATIEIKVIRVDGHKMTKATFNQIPTIYDLYDGLPSTNNMLGWVKDNGTHYLLFNDQGKPAKRKMDSSPIDINTMKWADRPDKPRESLAGVDITVKRCRFQQKRNKTAEAEIHLENAIRSQAELSQEWAAYKEFDRKYAAGEYIDADDYIYSHYDQLYIAT